MSSVVSDPLFQPFRLRHLALKNRVVSTAHEPAYTEDGMPKERYRAYHAEKAKGGVAMTMIGGSAVVAPDSPQGFGNIILYKDEVVRWLSELADDVHQHGAAVMIQITHMGRRTSLGRADWLPPVAPSHIREATHRAFPKAMEDWDIARVISAYGDAAERVKEAGLDGLELHCQSHLIDQFWSPATNKRNDSYGGSLENRMRFGFEVLSEIRKRVGSDFIVGARLVCDEDLEGGITASEGTEIAVRMKQSGTVDFLNVIRGHGDTHEGVSHIIPSMGYRSAPHLDFAGDIRTATNIPTIHAGRIQDVATARYAVESGKVDLVGLTRLHIADPYVLTKILANEEDRIRPCVGMGYCIDSIYGGESLCVHNAATGRELVIPHQIPRAASKRKVVIVGAGPGGLEAARVAGERGHEVIVFEAAPRAGGQILLAAALKRRSEIIGIVDWRLAECERLGVQFNYNCYADAHTVLEANPDVAIIATGGIPNFSFLKSGEQYVTSTWDILSGSVRPAENVILYDDNGAHPAMTAAEYLATQSGSLEVVTPERTLAPDIGGTNYPGYFKALNKVRTKFSLNLRLEKVAQRDNKLVATFFDEYARQYIDKEAEQIVVENGSAPLEDLYFDLKPLSTNFGEIDQRAMLTYRGQSVVRNDKGRFQLFRIGDAVASRNIYAAILDAVRLLKDA